MFEPSSRDYVNIYLFGSSVVMYVITTRTGLVTYSRVVNMLLKACKESNKFVPACRQYESLQVKYQPLLPHPVRVFTRVS